MPYMQLPQIDDRKSEKMAVLLTAENMGGLLLVAGPVYLATSGWNFLPRIVAILLAAVLGVVLTMPLGGMALYARLGWALRGMLYQATSSTDLLPSDLPGAAQRTQRGVVLPVDGVARIVQRDDLAVLLTSPPRPQPLHSEEGAV